MNELTVRDRRKVTTKQINICDYGLRNIITSPYRKSVNKSGRSFPGIFRKVIGLYIESVLREEPCTDPYARFCGQTGAVAPSDPTLRKRNVRPNQSAWMTAGWKYKDTLKQIRKLEDRYLPKDELKRAANAGDAKAQYFLSKELMRTDFDQALKLLEVAAHSGYAQVQYDMNMRISRRKHTDQEERQAIQWLIAVANSGHRAAMVGLGNHYRSGFARQNIQRNLYQAKLWYQRAIDGVDEIVY